MQIRIFATLMQKIFKKYTSRINPDLLGAIASVACAIHCMLVPIIVSIGLMNTSHHGHSFDFIMLTIGLIFAIYSLGKQYMVSRNITPILIVLLGFGLLILGIFSHTWILSVSGGLVVAYAHYINYSHSAVCKV